MSENIMRSMIKKGKKAYDKLICATGDPLAENTALLLELLRKNKDTEIGKRYDFKDIDSIEKYKASVPLLTYDDYSVYIDKLKREKFYQLRKDKLKYFAHTSGSMGNPKLIPLSDATISAILENHLIARYRTAHLYEADNLKYGRTLAVYSYIDVKTLPGDIKVGDITGHAIYTLKQHFGNLFTTPACSVFANEIHDFHYVHARFALNAKDITCISSAFMAEIFELIKYIITNRDRLIDDIEKGRIHYDVKMPEYVRNELKKLVRPDPARARELRDAFSSGDFKGILKKLWPGLLVINASGNASFKPYTKRVKYYAGESVSFFHPGYAASEGQIGTALEEDRASFSLLPHRMFYEFIPFEDIDKPDPETLTIDKLEKDKQYEIVLTNLSGFYRYRIKDIIKVTEVLGKTPQVEFLYRKNQVIDMLGEKVTYAQLESAVNECAKELGSFITEFAVYPDLRSGTEHYTIMLEKDDFVPVINADKFLELFDQKLGEVNSAFKALQSENKLGASKIEFVQPQTFVLYKDLQVMRGVSGNQIKPIRHIDTLEKEKFFFALLDKSE